MEGTIDWAPASLPGLVVTGSFSLLDTEITEVLTPTNDVRKGDSLAFAPEFQTTLRARYTWDLANGMRAHVMPHLAYSDESYSDIITINRQRLDSWLMLGVTAGVSNAQWSAELFVDNLTDEAAELSSNFVNDRDRVTLARPLTGGVRFTYNFD
jgi:iron complex outermembrane receptor protein